MSQASGKPTVIKVGDGRGFVVEDQRGTRVVITAAHCLPQLPPAHPWSNDEERTYSSLLGPLKGKPRVAAGCQFVDPIADVAVLVTPDSQKFYEEAEAYNEFVMGVEPILIADAPAMTTERRRLSDGLWIDDPQPGREQAQVLSLDGEWIAVTVLRRTSSLEIEDEGVIKNGMSGSPILTLAGKAMALVLTGSLNPILMEVLPRRVQLLPPSVPLHYLGRAEPIDEPVPLA